MAKQPWQQVFGELYPVGDHALHQMRLVVERHAPVLQPHQRAGEAEEGAEVQADDLAPLAAPAQVVVEVLSVAARIFTVQPRQQRLVVGFVLHREADVLGDALEVLLLAEQDAQLIADHLVRLVFLDHGALEVGIDPVVDLQPVDVEAAIQPQVVFQMAQMRHPLGQPLVMPAVERLIPQAHLHERDAIHRLEAHEAQEAFALG